MRESTSRRSASVNAYIATLVAPGWRSETIDTAGPV